MKKNLFRSLVALLLITVSAQAQSTRCHTMENLERLKFADPTLADRMLKIENQTQQIIAKSLGNGNFGITSVTNIPVVVHVVYNTSAQNISDAQIQSQINILNNDYRRLNADKVNTPSGFTSVAADAEITFCLAGVSPTGAATNGITRTHTSSTSFSDDDAVKYTSQGGEDAWPSDQYLNIWVCNLGGGLLGYAQFPGGPAATDGVVILYNGFGNTGTVAAPYNKGRSATHEIGHWLNLRHIWGDSNCGNDLVSDTPVQTEANYGCPSHPKSNSCGTSAEMFMNYMDYTDDACMNMFSLGQKARIKALFAPGGVRASLLNSSGCGGSTPPPSTCAVPSNLSASSVTQVAATLNWGAVSGALSYTVNVKAASSSSWTSLTSNAASLSVNGLSASTSYQFEVKTVCSSGSSAFSSIKTFSTPATTTTSSASVTIGTGTSVTGTAPYGTGYMDEKIQFIITKSELVTAGYSAANNILKSLAFNVYSASAKTMNSFTIKMRHTTANSYANTSYYSAANMTTVYTGNYTAVSGWNTHTFTTPFSYNGTDNLLVEICWDNSSAAADSKVYCSSTSSVRTLYKKANMVSGGVCDNATGGLSSSRPNVRLVFYGYSSAPASKLINDEDVLTEASQFEISDFNLYPNPTTSKINIAYSVVKESSTVEVMIYNMMGAVIGKYEQGVQDNGSHLFSLDLASDPSELPAGIYLCSVRVDDTVQTKRFVVKH